MELARCESGAIAPIYSMPGHESTVTWGTFSNAASAAIAGTGCTKIAWASSAAGVWAALASKARRLAARGSSGNRAAVARREIDAAINASPSHV